MKELKCNALLFDLDGVLVDSSACVARHWQRWAQRHGLDIDKIMQVAHGRRTVETVRLVAPHLSADKEATELAKNEAVDTDGIVGIDGAARLLRSLPFNRWAVVTSGSRDTATTRLNHTHLPVPPILITASDVTQGKPDPEPYLLAAVRLGVSPAECVVVEDAPAGIQSAHAAGMPVIAVVTTHSIDDLANAEVVVKQLADIQVMPTENHLFSRLTIRISQDWRKH